MVAGAAAVGVGAVVLGKVVYDACQENKGEKKKNHEETLLSLGWEEGVGKKGSRQVKKDKFMKLGQKEVKNLQFYEPPIRDNSASDFVSSFEYNRQSNSSYEEQGTRNIFSTFVNNMEYQLEKVSNLLSGTQN